MVELKTENGKCESLPQVSIDKNKKRMLSYHAPAGMDLKDEKRVFIIWMIASILISVMGFSARYMDSYERLYWKNGAERAVIPGAIMPDFIEILGESLLGFKIVFALVIAAVVIHYAYHFQDSKSIYTMRRLPSVWELHRRCLTLPVCGMVIGLGTAFVMLLLFYTVYMGLTPEICLTPGQWQKIWS